MVLLTAPSVDDVSALAKGAFCLVQPNRNARLKIMLRIFFIGCIKNKCSGLLKNIDREKILGTV
jgi:hypothetical protein